MQTNSKLNSKLYDYLYYYMITYFYLLYQRQSDRTFAREKTHVKRLGKLIGKFDCIWLKVYLASKRYHLQTVYF